MNSGYWWDQEWGARLKQGVMWKCLHCLMRFQSPSHIQVLEFWHVGICHLGFHALCMKWKHPLTSERKCTNAIIWEKSALSCGAYSSHHQVSPMPQRFPDSFTVSHCWIWKYHWGSKDIWRGWGCSSMVGHLPSTCEALGSILDTTYSKKRCLELGFPLQHKHQVGHSTSQIFKSIAQALSRSSVSAWVALKQFSVKNGPSLWHITSIKKLREHYPSTEGTISSRTTLLLIKLLPFSRSVSASWTLGILDSIISKSSTC